MTRPALRIRLRIYCGEEIAMGPGKADLLEAIEREGSISAAGRSLGMSYRRTWMLVDVMNRCWDEALVETATGGSRGGGARVTARGHDVLTHYRALQHQLATAQTSDDWATLSHRLRECPRPAQ